MKSELVFTVWLCLQVTTAVVEIRDASPFALSLLEHGCRVRRVNEHLLLVGKRRKVTTQMDEGGVGTVLVLTPLPPPNVRPRKIIPGPTDIQANSAEVQTDIVLINSGAGGHLGH